MLVHQASHTVVRDELYELIYGANKNKQGVQGVWSKDAELFMAANCEYMRRVSPVTLNSPCSLTRSTPLQCPSPTWQFLAARKLLARACGEWRLLKNPLVPRLC